MPPVTIYLPADLIDAARRRAGERHRSLSAWIAALVREATATEWPRGFVEVLRRGGGDLVEPDDPPPEDVRTLLRAGRGGRPADQPRPVQPR